MTDATGFLKPHQLPGLARINRFVDSLPYRDMTANPRFAGSGPNDVRIRRSNRQRANRRNRLRVEYRFPMNAAIDRLENSARRRARVVNKRLTRHSHDRSYAVAHWAKVSPAQRISVCRLGLDLSNDECKKYQCKSEADLF